jgi:hypothetical protein
MCLSSTRLQISTDQSNKTPPLVLSSHSNKLGKA